eukprot:67216-Lingulodinium_polyedra.AAC.1
MPGFPISRFGGSRGWFSRRPFSSEAVSPEPIYLHGEWIRGLRDAYGPECWWTIARAGIHTRSEDFERPR